MRTITEPQPSIPDISNGNRLRLRLDPDQHLFICGQTGSGKSYLADKLLEGIRNRKLIIDIKGLFEHADSEITDDVGQIPQLFRKHQSIIYQPSMPYDWDDINHAFHVAYTLGNTTIYNDERGGWPRPWDINLLPDESHVIMRGRQRHVAHWGGTQRPSRIPIPLMSESDHFFIFRLRHGMDRKKISEYAGDAIKEVLLPKRYFWYAGPNSEAAIYPPISVVTKKRLKNARRA